MPIEASLSPFPIATAARADSETAARADSETAARADSETAARAERNLQSSPINIIISSNLAEGAHSSAITSQHKNPCINTGSPKESQSHS